MASDNNLSHESDGGYAESWHRIASCLEDDLDLVKYQAGDLYHDLTEVGLQPPLDKDSTLELFAIMKGLIEERHALQSCIPFYRTKRATFMGINLARYALQNDDVFTAYYAAAYAHKPLLGQPTIASKLLDTVYATWDEWVDTLQIDQID